jgi:hypothetical protein
MRIAANARSAERLGREDERSHAIAQRTDRCVAARIVIGVTGHRTLQKEKPLADQVRAAIQKIRWLVPSLSRTPVVFSILSPLAEGADRLVVREALANPAAQLDVVLPLEKRDYLRDFKTPESKTEFEELLSRAHRVKRLQPATSRDEAYAQVGRYIVDHCDVLIAIWDGKSAAGHGGTAEIVEYARETRCPLFWIHTADAPAITEELGRGIDATPYQLLDEYNSESVDLHGVERCAQDRYQALLHAAESDGLAPDSLTAIREPLLSHYARADLLALRYQHLYLKAGSFIYVLAAAAVAVGAAQALFWPEYPQLVTIEVALMAALLGILWLGRRQRWHAKWKLTRDAAGELETVAARHLSGRWDSKGGRHCPSYVKGWDPRRGAWAERIYYAGAGGEPLGTIYDWLPGMGWKTVDGSRKAQ